MTDETIIRRINTAKSAVISALEDTKYDIIPPDCIIGMRKNEIRMIRVVVDEITANDIKIIKEINSPVSCTKEIWCRKKGKQKFEIKEIE